MPSYVAKKAKYKIAVNFDLDVYKRIKARAAKENKTFSEMASEACACGLRCYDENDYEEAGLSSLAMVGATSQ